MKIAYLCSYFFPAVDGPAQVIYELSQRYIKEGHEVHVYTVDSDKKQRLKIKEEIIDGIHVHRCYSWFKVANFSTFWPSVLFKLNKEKFDVIHTHVAGHAHQFFGALNAKFRGIKLIHTTHCPWTTENRSFFAKILLGIVYNTFMRLSFRWTDKIIAITPWEIQFIEKYGGKGKIEVIPNGMGKEFFNKVKNNDFKKKHGIKGKLILFFGRLNKTKGVDKFVLMANDLLKERKDLDFVIVGPDEGMLDEVKKIADKRIKILGAIRDRKEVVKMYQASEVYVLPSFREGLPLTLFEAFAVGLPVIASPVNGIPYEMKDNENGFFCDYGDISCLKSNVLKLVDNKKLREKMSKNNVNKAKQYDWDKIAEKVMEIYKN